MVAGLQYELSGQSVLVTGGTRGIGLEIAQRFLVAGARILITGTRAQSFQKLEATHPGLFSAAEFIEVDFLDPVSTTRFLEGISRLGRIDVLINNAGINRLNPVTDVRNEDLDDVLAVNLKAPTLLIREVGKLMKESGYGRIVNIGSIWGVISKAKRALYSVTKHGIHGLTIAAALDLGRHGVLVNTVSPGFVRTELTESILSPLEIRELAEQVPIGRFAEPADIAQVVLFLASPSNTYLTAQNVVVDGGFTNV
jgi:3-oxoacyl-[acyl-carrier protein] reductase